MLTFKMASTSDFWAGMLDPIACDAVPNWSTQQPTQMSRSSSPIRFAAFLHHLLGPRGSVPLLLEPMHMLSPAPKHHPCECCQEADGLQYSTTGVPAPKNVSCASTVLISLASSTKLYCGNLRDQQGALLEIHC